MWEYRAGVSCCHISRDSCIGIFYILDFFTNKFHRFRGGVFRGALFTESVPRARTPSASPSRSIKSLRPCIFSLPRICMPARNRIRRRAHSAEPKRRHTLCASRPLSIRGLQGVFWPCRFRLPFRSWEKNSDLHRYSTTVFVFSHSVMQTPVAFALMNFSKGWNVLRSWAARFSLYLLGSSYSLDIFASAMFFRILLD